MVLVVVALVVAVGVGLAANYVSGFIKADEEKDPTEGTTVTAVLGATALLAAFIVALVLSGTAGSYNAANTASKNEADLMDTFYESAEYVDMPFRRNLQAAAVCYARAVAGPEWKEMAHGDRSPVPSNWTGTGEFGIRKTLIAMGTSAKGFSLVQSADAKRGELRNERIRQASPTVPAALFWLAIVLVAISLGNLAFGIPRSKNVAHLLALGLVTTLFALTIGLLYNLDRPFSGVLAQKPTDMENTAVDIGQDYVDTYQAEPPCDREGRPTATS